MVKNQGQTVVFRNTVYIHVPSLSIRRLIDTILYVTTLMPAAVAKMIYCISLGSGLDAKPKI